MRRYEPFVVAETPMSGGAGPASGAGFSELAGYIFGGNAQRLSMEMTTPGGAGGGQGWGGGCAAGCDNTTF